MKNSLELELQMKIKRANRFLVAKEYPAAIQQYTQGLNLYQENRKYNECISQQFQALLYSLRANSHSYNFNTQEAQEDFEKSLSINPYNSVTFSRRAKHYIKEKKYRDAVQDIDLALLYDPENLTYLSLLNSVQNFVNNIADPVEKQQISLLVTEVKNRLTAKPPTQSESDSEDQEELLNFSKLKKIDRESIRVSPSKLESRKSIIEFKDDEVIEYESEEKQKQQGEEDQEEDQIAVAHPNKLQLIAMEKKFQDQEKQIEALQAEQEQDKKSQNKIESVTLTKSVTLSRKSILRRSSFSIIDSFIPGQEGENKINASTNKLFISTPALKLSSRSSISASSIKDIDGKVVKQDRQLIKFKPRSSLSAFAELKKNTESNLCLIDEKNEFENEKEKEKENLTRTTPNLKNVGCNQQRKSCLRMSMKFSSSQNDFISLSKSTPTKGLNTVESLPQTKIVRRSSNFDNIRSIDGGLVKKSPENSDDEFLNVNVKIQSEESDDQNDEHDIFGGRKKERKESLQVCGNILFILDQMENLPQAINSSLSKKKSILKKDSFMGDTVLSWKLEKKKSVLFKTAN